MSMSATDFLFLLLIAAVCGAIAQALTGFARGGLLVAVAVGFVGALIGLWLQKETGLPELLTIELNGRHFPVVWSILGGALFAALLGFIARPAVRRRRAAY